MKSLLALTCFVSLVGGVAHAEKAANLTHLNKVNPNLGRILSDNPGVAKYLDRMAKGNAVFDGSLGKTKQPTKVSWTIWNHSEQTSKEYGHRMKDDTILNKDVVVVWQKGDKRTKSMIDLGYQKARGKIVGVYQLRDLVQSGRWADGGFNAQMQVEGAGQPGKKDAMAYAVVGIDGNGRVMGGGLPDMRGDSAVTYQTLKAEKRRASGHQYEGRASDVVHGQSNYVPLADGASWAGH